jgi:cytochrome c5
LSEYQILGELAARVRDIKVAVDGSIWVLLESGAIYRLSRDPAQFAKDRGIGQRDGEQVYLAVCSSCHSQNVVGVPQISVKSDWSARLQKKRGDLYDSAINGLNAMPEKGLCEDCTNNEIQRAVNFMISQINQ